MDKEKRVITVIVPCNKAKAEAVGTKYGVKLPIFEAVELPFEKVVEMVTKDKLKVFAKVPNHPKLTVEVNEKFIARRNKKIAKADTKTNAARERLAKKRALATAPVVVDGKPEAAVVVKQGKKK